MVVVLCWGTVLQDSNNFLTHAILKYDYLIKKSDNTLSLFVKIRQHCSINTYLQIALPMYMHRWALFR
jgi:hypothetical protein